MAITQPALFDATPKASRIARLTQRGDIWQLGRHRLMCADSVDSDAICAVLSGVRIEDVLSDPPYGIDYNGNHSRFSVRPSAYWQRPKNDRVTHTDRRAVCNDTTPFDPTPWLSYKRVCLWGAHHYAASLPAGSWLIWDKRHKNGHALLSDGDMAWMNRGHGVYIYSHVWQGMIRAEPEPHLHPTQKPVALMAWCLAKMKARTHVLDPFAGSCPTVLACERTDRTCYAMEIEPQYCDKALWRWQRETGITPTLQHREATVTEGEGA